MVIDSGDGVTHVIPVAEVGSASTPIPTPTLPGLRDRVLYQAHSHRRQEYHLLHPAPPQRERDRHPPGAGKAYFVLSDIPVSCSPDLNLLLPPISPELLPCRAWRQPRLSRSVTATCAPTLLRSSTSLTRSPTSTSSR